MLLLWILLFSVLGGAGAIAIAGSFFRLNKKVQEALIPSLLSYATGTLLAAALLSMIPHALEEEPREQVLATVLVGIVVFFVLEKLVIWRHCHDGECETHRTPGPVLIIGDGFHNFIDGVIIAASFLVSVPVGIIAGLSLIAHEIPQELGEFGILVHSGYSRKKALYMNLLSSLASVPGALIAYVTLDSLHSYVPYALALGAASFIYIALSDLSPELHQETSPRRSVRQVLLLLAGILTIVLFMQFHAH